MWTQRVTGFLLGCAGLFLFSTVAFAQTSFDQDPFDRILKQYVKEGRVNYSGLKAKRRALDRYVVSLGKVEPEQLDHWTQEEQIAFWINAYNAITLKVIIDHYPIKRKLFPRGMPFPVSSIQQIPGKWDKITHLVLGEAMTLDHIEHKILREKFKEPRIHMALVCAAKGCPPLRSEAYRGRSLESQLEDQSRTFLAERTKLRIDRKYKRVYISPILKWFGDDFLKGYGAPEGFGKGKDVQRAVLKFISDHVSPEDAAFLEKEEYRIKYLEYAWGLNEQ